MNPFDVLKYPPFHFLYRLNLLIVYYKGSDSGYENSNGKKKRRKFFIEFF